MNTSTGHRSEGTAGILSLTWAISAPVTARIPLLMPVAYWA